MSTKPDEAHGPEARVGEARVGMSGWVFPPWRGDFYPKGLPQHRELEYASRQLNSIEINSTFYRLQSPTSWAKWRDHTPGGFVFAVKGWKVITHERELVNVRGPLARFFGSGMLALGDKLGPFLWQLPPGYEFDADTLDAFLTQLPRTTDEAEALAAENPIETPTSTTATLWDEPENDRPATGNRPLRHAIEVRDFSFDTDDYFALLETHGVASVVGDTAGKWPFFTRVTTDFAYIRMHGDKLLYENGYTSEALDAWQERIAGWLDEGLDTFVYFDNDTKTRSPHDAVELSHRLGLAGAND